MSNSNDTLIMEESNAVMHPKDPVENVSVQVTDENVSEASSSVEVPSSETSTDVSDPHTKLEFNRANVEAQGNHVHLVDSDEDNKLDMFCYVRCSETDNSFLKQCRGVVFNENNLVMKAFPYTTEYNNTEVENITQTIGDFKKWTFYDAHEGALIRMFHFNGKWYVSTHRKLNAFRSKWASRDSFGTSFKAALSSEEEVNEVFRNGLSEGENILERFQSTLDTRKQYMFLVRNNKDNRIVCSPPDRPTVFHVGTFVDGKLVMTENVNIPHPKKLQFTNVDELLHHVKETSYRDLQGVIGFTDDNRQIKVIHQDYQDLFRARGNEPSIKFRYLQIRMNRRFVNMLYHLYPEMTDIFDEYENILYDICRSIYRAYVQRFIKRRYVTVPREEFAVIRECHSWHLANRTENRISLNQIIKVMNQQSPTHLNHMLRRFKLEQSRQKEQQLIARPRSDSVRSTKSFEQSPLIHKINTTKPVPVSPLVLSQNANYDKRNQVARILPRKPLYKPSEESDEKEHVQE